ADHDDPRRHSPLLGTFAWRRNPNPAQPVHCFVYRVLAARARPCSPRPSVRVTWRRRSCPCRADPTRAIAPRSPRLMLECHKLRKTFSGFVAANDVCLTVEQNSVTAVIGPNGAGKSTLFNLITGHLYPDSGKVILNGRDITGVPPHRICAMGIGRSFQRTNIFPMLTVFENIQA